MNQTRIPVPGYTPGRRKSKSALSALPLGQVIFPAGVPSSFAAGTPTIKGPQNRIFPTGVPSSFATGYPTIVGGTTNDMVLLIGGVQFAILRLGASDPIPGAGSATAPQLTSQTIGRWTAQFDVYTDDNSQIPAIGQTVILIEFGVRLFMGCISEALAERLTSTDRIVYHVTALDKSSILDHRIVNVVYKTGEDAAAAVRDLVSVQLAGEGLTLNTLAISILPLSTDISCFFIPASRALDNLAQDAACVWWVDAFGDLHFTPIVTLPPCPYSILESSGAAPTVWRALSIRTTTLDYRNKQYAVSNLQVIPAKAGGAASLAIQETYTLPQAAAQAAGLLFGAIITNFPIGTITSMTVNGVSQPAYSGTLLYNFRHAWWYFPGAPYLTPPNAQNDLPIYPNPPVTSPDPNAGDVVVINYVPSTPSGAPVGSSQSAGIAIGTPLSAAGGTCGTGIYEAVEQVKNINLLSDLNAIAAAVLARSGGVPKYLQFETDQPGAQVGQQITVNLPSMGSVSDSYLITSVQMTSKGTDLGRGTSFTSVVVAQTGQDIGNSLKWYERLIARTENALPVLQEEDITFVLGPGSSVSSGVNVTNPYIMARSGLCLECLLVAGGAAVNQNLVVDILDNGTSIFGVNNKPSIPAGSTSLVVALAFAVPKQYLYTHDVLTINTSYQVIGANPTPASNVTIKLRVAI